SQSPLLTVSASEPNHLASAGYGFEIRPFSPANYFFARWYREIIEPTLRRIVSISIFCIFCVCRGKGPPELNSFRRRIVRFHDHFVDKRIDSNRIRESRDSSRCFIIGQSRIEQNRDFRDELVNMICPYRRAGKIDECNEQKACQ